MVTAREALDILHRYSFGRDDEITHPRDITHLVQIISDALPPVKPVETDEEKSWREFRESQQRAADMRQERAQRKLEEDAAAHQRHLKSQGWDMQ